MEGQKNPLRPRRSLRRPQKSPLRPRRSLHRPRKSLGRPPTNPPHRLNRQLRPLRSRRQSRPRNPSSRLRQLIPLNQPRRHSLTPRFSPLPRIQIPPRLHPRLGRGMRLLCRLPPIPHPRLLKAEMALRGMLRIPTPTWAWAWPATMTFLPHSPSPISVGPLSEALTQFLSRGNRRCHIRLT